MSNSNNNYNKSATCNLIGFIGNCIAVTWSWSTNHSVGWAILHTILGWLYVFYRVLGFGG